ncbi:Fic family protein [Anaerococcus prevotii]|uniref:Fic family protein n=1 Tax=Anaerococcus prevotii ACS-065-V-Col13 TaxID=879305 RepID=F0GV34_9FIRM|nr:Fic family protein [Anaerococcus prevotii]EGC82251.1 Fic family protein [Anaerococcus prevotii ACS-065-V-Col13]
MDYIFKKYYKKENYKKSYEDRINFEASLKLDFIVKDYPLYFVFNSYTANLLDKIRVLDIEIDNLFDRLPDVAKYSFLDDIIVEEIFSSNEIEGVRSTREEILLTKKQLEVDRNANLRFKSIINSYLDLSMTDKLSSLEDIRDYYDRVVGKEISDEDQPDSSLFRVRDVYIKSNRSYDGSYIHKGLDADLLNQYMEKWLMFMNDENLHLMIRVAIGHYLFEYMHPFYDGNGRLGRFLSSMYIRNSYSYLTSLAVSRGAFIKKNDYYKSFKQTNADINMGELNYFVDEFVKIIIKAQEDMKDLLNSNIAKLDKSWDWLNDEFADDKISLTVLFILSQDYIFSAGSGINRETILEELSSTGFGNRTKNIRSFDKLEGDGYIQRVKSRPITYKLDDSVVSRID